MKKERNLTKLSGPLRTPTWRSTAPRTGGEERERDEEGWVGVVAVVVWSSGLGRW